MPLGLQTRLDWRNVDYFKMYVDAYEVNTDIADLAAPAEVRNAPEPESYPVRPPGSLKVDRGIWRLTTGTTVVEFKDYLLLYEFNVNTRNQAKATLDYIRSLAPGKPIKYLVVSHNHFDHTIGLRSAVAAGITVITRPDTLTQFRELVARPAPNFPDDLAMHPVPFKAIALGEHLRLQDETQTLDIYWSRNSGHMADSVFAYAPEYKLMMEGDLATAAFTYQHWADTFRDVIAYYHLDVQKDSPVHSVWREHPDVLTRDQVEEILKTSVMRAREHCNDLQAKGVYHPGCPVQSKYY
jgi:glyoxylase-like metal-dependent hydrolase (beta-lactamase superfamily II)